MKKILLLLVALALLCSCKKINSVEGLINRIKGAYKTTKICINTDSKTGKVYRDTTFNALVTVEKLSDTDISVNRTDIYFAGNLGINDYTFGRGFGHGGSVSIVFNSDLTHFICSEKVDLGNYCEYYWDK